MSNKIVCWLLLLDIYPKAYLYSDWRKLWNILYSEILTLRINENPNFVLLIIVCLQKDAGSRGEMNNRFMPQTMSEYSRLNTSFHNVLYLYKRQRRGGIKREILSENCRHPLLISVDWVFALGSISSVHVKDVEFGSWNWTKKGIVCSFSSGKCYIPLCSTNSVINHHEFYKLQLELSSIIWFLVSLNPGIKTSPDGGSILECTVQAASLSLPQL